MPTKSWKNHLKKLHTYSSWDGVFSAAPTAQNSPELHFCLRNSFIQPSLLGSLLRPLLYFKLKAFAVLFSIDIVASLRNLFTETMMSINNKTANSSSLKYFLYSQGISNWTLVISITLSVHIGPKAGCNSNWNQIDSFLDRKSGLETTPLLFSYCDCLSIQLQLEQIKNAYKSPWILL